MREATLCYLLRWQGQYREVCLAPKLTSGRYVPGRLNAAGGHVKCDIGETPRGATIREEYEEQGVLVRDSDLVLIARLQLIFPGKEWDDLDCYAFATTCWHGQPQVTAEMGSPEWHLITRLPIDRLPPVDAQWLERALRGERWRFVFSAVDADFQPLVAPDLYPLEAG